MGLFRWAGSKDRILDELFALIAKDEPFYSTWYVPFYGAGSDGNEAAIRGYAKRFIFNDSLTEIPLVLKALTIAGEELQALLRAFEAQDIGEQKRRFLELRREPNAKCLEALPTREILDYAFRFLVLQACGYRGVWRVNQKAGQYNVPWNRKACFDFEYLEKIRQLLTKRVITYSNLDFEDNISLAKAGDLVYADPPYIGTHSAYSSKGFTINDHHRLYQALRSAVMRGVVCWLSNSDCEQTKQIYYGTIYKIEARRSMSRKAQAQNTKKTEIELLIKIAA